MHAVNPVQLIEEVKKHPGLYNVDHPADRDEKIALWKQIGAEIYPDWNDYNKATAYDKVLQMQRKWRSLRDAYNRELRSRRNGVRVNKKVYRYFKRMSFLGGYGDVLVVEDDNCDDEDMDTPDDPLIQSRQQKPRKQRRIKRDSDSIPPPEELEIPSFSVESTENEGIANETDSDRLFLMSFLPEIKQLPINIKMWTRAQIANIMQEAVTCHYNNTCPGTDRGNIKRQRQDSSE